MTPEQIKLEIVRIRRDRVRRARATPSMQKLWSGPELFDTACSVMRSGIRMQHRGADPATVEQILNERLHRAVRRPAGARP